MKTLISFLGFCSLLLSIQCSKSDLDDIPDSSPALLFLTTGDPAVWTIDGGVYSQYEEIQHWKESGYEVETMDLASTDITEALLDSYDALRIACGGLERLDSEGEAIYNWVLNGGGLFAELSFSQPINLLYRFGIQDIEGQHGGASGLDWFYHGAPWVFGPVACPKGTVNSVAAASMDRPVLKDGHTLTVDATIDGYPIVVHGDFGQGKAIIIFAQHWSIDETKASNAYRSTIFMEDNIQFLGNSIDYFKE